jgi:hypothetical protein
MDNIVPAFILLVSLTTGCAYHQRVASVQSPQVTIGSIDGSTMGSGTRVLINLSEQRAYLIEGGKISLISRSLPRMLTIGLRALAQFSMARAGSQHRTQLQALMCRPVSVIDPRQCHTTWSSVKQLACTPVFFQGIPPPTDVCGCLETSRRGFSKGSGCEPR